MPLTTTEIEQALRNLRLPGMRATLHARALDAATSNLPFLDVFSMLVQDELDRRKTKLIERRFALSGLAEKKTLSEFDWAFNPKIPRRACLELLALKFLAQHENALFIGPPGTGKSHVAKAIGHAAVLAGHRLFYRPAHLLVHDIRKARLVGDTAKLSRQIESADLVIIDDLFLKRLPADAGDDLVEIIMDRYEKGSTLITSNRPFDDWAKLLGDTVSTGPVLDRLLHHGHSLRFEGKSYRLKEAGARLARAAHTG